MFVVWLTTCHEELFLTEKLGSYPGADMHVCGEPMGGGRLQLAVLMQQESARDLSPSFYLAHNGNCLCQNSGLQVVLQVMHCTNTTVLIVVLAVLKLGELFANVCTTVPQKPRSWVCSHRLALHKSVCKVFPCLYCACLGETIVGCFDQGEPFCLWMHEAL